MINTVILIELEGYAMNGFTFNLTYNLLGFIDWACLFQDGAKTVPFHKRSLRAQHNRVLRTQLNSVFSRCFDNELPCGEGEVIRFSEDLALDNIFGNNPRCTLSQAPRPVCRQPPLCTGMA